MAKYRILSLDGGGIKGVFSAQVLKLLCEEFPDFINQVDLVAGTSTGSILAGGLARGLTPTELVNLYSDNGEKIFYDTVWDDIADMGNMIGAEYDYTNLKTMLTKYYGKTTTLNDLTKKVLIPVFLLDNKAEVNRTWKPIFYSNYREEHLSELLVDCVVKSSVAPTYFPSYQSTIDGGVAANSPSMCAVAQALNQGISSNDIILLSVGTGFYPTYVKGKKLDWGITQWGPLLIDVFMDSMAFVADYQCERILGCRYKRVNHQFDQNIKLDDYTKIPTLINYANTMDLSNVKEWIRNNW